MTEYLLRLAIALPAVGLMVWSSLWLWRRAQQSAQSDSSSQPSLAIDTAISLGRAGRLATIRFGDQRLLVFITNTDCRLLSTCGLERRDAQV
jgi:flagellar protein FliO/FliZ